MPAWTAIAAVAACIDYGVVGERERDHWTQPAREHGVDILWVVDDSPSMAEERAILAASAASFAALLPVTPVDWRLLVTTTDVDDREPGALVADPLSPGDPDPGAALAAVLEALAEGSRDERGFEAALAAADPEGPNAGVLRPEADLEVIFASDEDDHSDLDVDAFLEELAALRPDAAVRVHALVGDLPDGCASATAAADPGERYAAAAEATGGRRESLCDPDPDALMERLGADALGMATVFALSAVPLPWTLEVRVDGALVHRRDVDGWRYEGGDNAIVFDGFAVPPPGAEVVATYAPWTGGPLPDTGEGGR